MECCILNWIRQRRTGQGDLDLTNEFNIGSPREQACQSFVDSISPWEPSGCLLTVSFTRTASL